MRVRAWRSSKTTGFEIFAVVRHGSGFVQSGFCEVAMSAQRHYCARRPHRTLKIQDSIPSSASSVVIQPASRLHVRAKTRRVRPHQTRAQTTLRDRGGDWTYEGTRSSRPLLSLRGRAGDAANVILSAIGYNLRLVLAWLRMILRLLLLLALQMFAIQPAFKPAS